MSNLNCRHWIYTVGSVSLGALATGSFCRTDLAASPSSDSLPMQLYKSLSKEQRLKVCLPANHPRRQYANRKGVRSHFG